MTGKLSASKESAIGTSMQNSGGAPTDRQSTAIDNPGAGDFQKSRKMIIYPGAVRSTGSRTVAQVLGRIYRQVEAEMIRTSQKPSVLVRV